MAKYEHSLRGNFSNFLSLIHNGIVSGSVSARYEDGSDITVGDVRVAVRVYERYSTIGSNRVSLNVTLAGEGDNLHLIAITSGGSQAVFFKLNTFGEEAFLKKLKNIVGTYTGQ